ncbi:MAG: SRPBCC family protein [Phycisphaerales bacterium JB043]
MEFSAHYKAPRQRVFDVFMDLESMADTLEGVTRVEVLTDGPVGKGTRWRETRMIMGKERTEELAITEVRAPESYDVECDSCGCLMKCRFTFEEQDGGTTMRMTMQNEPYTLFARIVTPLMMPLMRKQMHKCMDKDFEDVRAVLENGAAVGDMSS